MPATPTSLEHAVAPRRYWRIAVPALAILLLTLAAYTPAMRAGYIWDDPDYVTENQHIRSLDGLARIWTPRNTPQYYPLVFTSFWVEYHLWALRPLGYHLTNIILHALTAVLVWRVLLRLSVPAAWCCAAVFALHPVHVESVAWITERKNVLSALFYMLTLWSWLRYDVSGKNRWYFAAVLLFVAAMLSKTVAASLPVALLLIVWCRDGRLKVAHWISLLPLFIIGLALGLLTAWLERHHVGAQGVDWDLSPAQRILIAGRGLWFYACSLAFPANLTFVYPRWAPEPARLIEWLAPASALAVLLLLWLMRSRWGRAPLAACLFFTVTLFPALGFFDVFPFRYSFVADHFQYLASLGLIVLAVGGLGRAFSGATVPQAKSLATVMAALTLIVLGSLTFRQCRIYRDAETLYRDTLAKNSDAWMAHFNLGLILDRRGDAAEAHQHYLTTVLLRPQHHKAHTLLARDYTKSGEVDTAVMHYLAALDADPRLLTANINLGNIYASRGQFPQAIHHYNTALETRSPLPEANFALGNTLSAMGDFSAAVEQYRLALTVGPDDAPTHGNLGMALLPLGRLDEAAAELETALRLQPDLADTRLLLVGALSRRGDYARAAATLRAGLEVSPADERFIGALAWILSTCPEDAVRDGAEAVTLAERLAVDQGRGDANTLKTLAAACAEAARFDDALRHARVARALANDQQRLAEQIDRMIAAFQGKRPYRSQSAE